MSADVSSRGANGPGSAAPCPALLQEAQAVARALTRALPEAGVFVVDADLRIVVFAGAVPAARGPDAEVMLGRVASDAFPATAGPIRDGCTVALAGGTWHGVHVASSDGIRFAVQTSPLELADGRVAGAVVVLQDATPRDSASADLGRRLAQQAAVAELGLRITEGLAGGALEHLAAELCRRAMEADLTSVIEIPAGGGDVAILRAGTGWTPGSIGRAELPLAADRLAGYVVRAGGPVVIDDLETDARCSSPLLLAQGMTCGISTPIGNPRAPLGILGAHSRTPRRFSLEDVALMQSIASLLAGAAERERSAGLMQEAQARFRSAFQYAPIGMALFDTSPRPGDPILMQVNDALCAMLGYDAEALGRADPLALSHPEDLYIGVAEGLALASGRAPSCTVEKRLLRADGTVMHARIRGSLVLGSDGETGYGICQVEDLTETTLLRRQEDRIWELSADLLAIIGPAGFVRVSPSWETCLGFSAAELSALPFEQLIHPEDQQLSSDAFARAVDVPDVESHFECRVRTSRGDWRWLAWSARCAEREGDDPVRVYCTARDITDRRETQRALVESLSLFDQSFENAPIGMSITEPSTGRLLRVNDALCRLLGRSEYELLALDSVLEITHPDDQAGAQAVLADDVAGDGTFQTEKRYVRPDGSTPWCSLHVTPIRDADGTVTALFGQIIDIDEQKARQTELERKLDDIGWVERIREALEHGRLELHSQPIVDLASGEIVQRELLIRMRDEAGELVPPGMFLPAAEEHGLIEDIDRWVLSQAVQLAARGEAVEVNVSAASMSRPAFLTAVERELERSGADPACLVFEITETALMRQMDLGVAFAERLASLGCRFALDDFGTGYASFTYLKRLPVHYLKIDRDFVRELVASPRDRHVVQAIVNLASGFEAQTIAEGVEDAETLKLLSACGVDYAQGFHLGRPAPLTCPARGA